jgi:excisionase family DNA binding protein
VSAVELLTVAEAAKAMRVHPRTVYRLVNERAITAVHMGRKILIPASTVEAYIRAHTHQALRGGR